MKEEDSVKISFTRDNLQPYTIETLGSIQILVPTQAIEHTKRSLSYSDNRRDYTNLTWESPELQVDDKGNPFFHTSIPIRHIRNPQSLGFIDGNALEEFVETIENAPSPNILIVEEKDAPRDSNGTIILPFYRNGLMNLCLAHYNEELTLNQREKISFIRKATKDLMVIYSALCCYTKELIEDDFVKNLYEKTRLVADILTETIDKKYDKKIKELIAYFRSYFNDTGIWADKDDESLDSLLIPIDFEP
jgi:hypothetical protein